MGGGKRRRGEGRRAGAQGEDRRAHEQVGSPPQPNNPAREPTAAPHLESILQAEGEHPHRRRHAEAPAHPVPEAKRVGGVQAKRLHRWEVGGHGHHVPRDGLHAGARVGWGDGVIRLRSPAYTDTLAHAPPTQPDHKRAPTHQPTSAPSLSTSQARTVRAFSIVSAVVKVLDTMTARVVSAGGGASTACTPGVLGGAGGRGGGVCASV